MNVTLLIVAFVPAILVALLAYFLLEKFFKNESNRREYLLRKQLNEQITPQKLQAYERMAMFLERIKPSALVMRISPESSAKNYERLLIANIQTEWDYNLSQQIYISPDTWQICFSAKNATQLFLRECVEEAGENITAQELKEYILKKSVNDNPPSNGALLKLAVDVQGNL